MYRDLASVEPPSIQRFNKEKGREPSIEEIAKELGVQKEEIAFSFDAIQDPVSLQEPIYNDGSGDLLYNGPSKRCKK